MPLTRDEDIADILGAVRTIAVVGASAKPERASYGVMAKLIAHGYDVYPINPALVGQKIHGRDVLAALAHVPQPIDMVDIFRNSDAVPEVVEEAIAAGAKVIWMQLGVIHEHAAARAQAAGLKVVMDRCPAIEIPRLRLPPISADRS